MGKVVDERVELANMPSDSWRCVVRHPDGQRELGILSDGTWAIRHYNTAIRLAKPSQYLFALTMLEMEYRDFIAQYEESVIRISETISITPFPLLEFLTVVAFKFDREGWRERALNWLSLFPPSSLRDLKDDLALLQSDKRHWQKNRHAAKRLVAAIQRSQIGLSKPNTG